MAGQTGTVFPFAAVAVVVAFVSSVVLVQKPFDLLRPPETTKAQYRPAHTLEVDARLWEDPFTAGQRFEAERLARCKEKPAQAATPAPECDEQELAQRRSVEHLIRRWPSQPEVRRLLLPVLVPGNPFVGAEEERRRARYAILAGLNAQGYVPNDAEHIGLLDFEQFNEDKTRRSRHVAIPYERLQTPPAPAAGSARREYDEVLLLWVDEAGLRQPKLDNFARLLEQFALGCELPGRERKPDPTMPCADLAVIGPSSSDALHTAIDDLKHADPKYLGATTLDGYRYLARARIFNSAATADVASLGVVTTGSDGATRPFDVQMQEFVTGELKRIIGTAPSRPFAYRSTIANENALVSLLISELNARGVTRHGSRIVLLSEWDSLYAQTLVERLRSRLGAASTQVKVEVRNYLRGIDGVTAKDDSKPAPPDKTIVEWPEARDQRDYLRRLAGELAGSQSDDRPVGAIGVLGSDVHDKLLALQALRDAFPDKTFFTTDLDARFLHPRTLSFTRNLIIATSLPLAFDDPALQGAAPPFRDVYQSADFLAARLAASASQDAALLAEVDDALDNPRLYEVGLGGPVLLGTLGSGAPTKSSGPSWAQSLGVAALTAGAVLLLWYWPSTPSLRRARESMAHPIFKLGEEGRIVASFVAAHNAALVFAFASLVELIWPGHLTFTHALAWSALAAALAFAAIYPGPCWLANRSRVPFPRSLGEHPATGGIARVALLLVIVAFGLAVIPPASFGIFEPVLWSQGVSGWPSQLLRLLALMAALASIDYAWFGTLASAEKLSNDLGFEESTMFRLERARTLRIWMSNYSIATWRYPRDRPVDFETLWTDYRHRGRSWARAVRVLFWTVLTLLFLYWLFTSFGGGYRLEVPVRGDEHRELMRGTLILESIAFVLLVVATADATMLACRFVRHLTRGRSIYPKHVIDRFAAQMGPVQEAAWRTRITTGGIDSHTLLDDWIDMQILARRTADIAPLIFLPSSVLALLVIAHSRLFDSWALTPSVVLMFAFYLLWLMTLAALLKFAADRARREAVQRMKADQRFLQGAQDDLAKLAKPMEGLIAAVENERRGAFADLFDQPLLKAILVPLGGASGIQLLDYFLLAK